MEALVVPRSGSYRLSLWFVFVVLQLILACAVVLFPYYVVPVSFGVLLLLAMFFYPELTYYLFVLFLCCHFFNFWIVPAHSVPLRVKEIMGVRFDVIALPALLANVFVVMAFVSWTFARMARTRPAYPGTSLDLPMLVFFIWVAFSLFWSPDASTWFFKMFVLLVCYVGFFLSVALLRTKKAINTVIWLLIFVGLVNSGVAAYSLHGEPASGLIYRAGNSYIAYNFIHTARERGMGLSFSTVTAYFLSIIIILAVGMFLVTKKKRVKFLLALIILFLGYGELTCLSKGGLLALLCGLFFLIVTYKPLRRKWFIVLPAIVVILAVLAACVYFTWPWPERTELFAGRKKSLFPRQIIWNAGFENLIETYGFGYGGGAFFPAHNICFSVLFETGFIGLFIWLWLLIRLFNTVNGTLKKQLSPYYHTMILVFSAGVVSILIFGLVDSIYWSETMWAFLGFGMAIVNLANAPSPENAVTTVSGGA